MFLNEWLEGGTSAAVTVEDYAKQFAVTANTARQDLKTLTSIGLCHMRYAGSLRIHAQSLIRHRCRIAARIDQKAKGATTGSDVAPSRNEAACQTKSWSNTLLRVPCWKYDRRFHSSWSCSTWASAWAPASRTQQWRLRAPNVVLTGSRPSSYTASGRPARGNPRVRRRPTAGRRRRPEGCGRDRRRRRGRAARRQNEGGETWNKKTSSLRWNS